MGRDILDLYSEKTLWKKVEKFVRAYEGEDAYLIFDDTIAKKMGKRCAC